MGKIMGASRSATGLGAPEGAEPDSRLGASPAIPCASDVFHKAWAAMNRRASLRAEWLDSMPEGHPMRVLATLQNTAACFMGRQSEADRIDMLKAIDAAKAIEDEAFAEWRAASER